MNRPYAKHSAFVAPARLKAGMGLLVFSYFAIEFGYRISLDLLDSLLRDISPDLAGQFYQGSSPLSLAAQLMSFGFLALCVVLAVRFLHKRSPLTLIGPLRPAVQDFWAVLVPVTLLLVGLELIPPWWSSDALERTRSLGPWLALFPFALSAIFIQIGAEELLYRGYLQQQLAAVFTHPAVWLILTNAAFGLAHWQTGGGGAASVQYVIWAFFFGLAASDLTARAGNLGPALALHLANNAFAFLLYAEEGGFSSGFAFFLFPPQSMGTAFTGTGPATYFSWQLAIEIFILALLWLAARIGLRR